MSSAEAVVGAVVAVLLLTSCLASEPEPSIALTSLGAEGLAVAIRTCPGETVREVRIYRPLDDGEFDQIGSTAGPSATVVDGLTVVPLLVSGKGNPSATPPDQGALTVEVDTTLTTVGATFDGVENAREGSYWNGETTEDASDLPPVDCPE